MSEGSGLLDMMEHSLAFRFHDQSPSYVLGFEAGQLHERFRQKLPIEKHTAHTENLPTLHLMAEYHGHSLIVDPTAIDGWCEITAVPQPKKPILLSVK